MAAFSYQARDEAGRMVKGLLEADSQAALAERLRRMGYLVTRMEEAGSGLSRLEHLRFGRVVNEEDLLLVCVQLSNLVEVGLPLVAALQTVTEQAGSAALREAIEAVAREIEGGAHFSDALQRHTDVFPKLMVSMAAVGEASGKLDLVLTRFANLLERDLALRRTVQAALTYPAFLLVISTGLILFMVTFVVPQFTALFSKAGLVLPAPTRLLSAIGMTLRYHLGWLIGAGLLLVLGAGLALRQPAVRHRFDRLLWKTPIVGPVIQHSVIARFARNLATLIGSGVSILSALDAAKEVAQNQVMVEELDRVRSSVERGERIAATLAVGKVFRPDVIQMIRVGEETGRLDTLLDKVADFYDLRLRFFLKQMSTLLEPVLLAGMGGIVAFLMASLLLPMFDLVGVLQKGGFR